MLTWVLRRVLAVVPVLFGVTLAVFSMLFPVRGDLGTSIRSRRPVTTEIGENAGSTALLAVAAMLVAVGLGVPLGLLAALSRNSWLDVASMATALLGVSMPSFWLGLLLIFVFSLHLAWFPATGGGDLQ